MKTFRKILKSCAPLLAVAVALWVILNSIGNLSADSREEEKQHLEDALRRAAVSCYASEGFYPPDLDYICSRYGIQIDTDSFVVFYEVFAENIMPQINVVERNE